MRPARARELWGQPGKTDVCELGSSVGVQQDIGRLEVPVEDCDGLSLGGGRKFRFSRRLSPSFKELLGGRKGVGGGGEREGRRAGGIVQAFHALCKLTNTKGSNLVQNQEGSGHLSRYPDTFVPLKGR